MLGCSFNSNGTLPSEPFYNTSNDLETLNLQSDMYVSFLASIGSNHGPVRARCQWSNNPMTGL